MEQKKPGKVLVVITGAAKVEPATIHPRLPASNPILAGNNRYLCIIVNNLKPGRQDFALHKTQGLFAA
jgi:hypothetical protein